MKFEKHRSGVPKTEKTEVVKLVEDNKSDFVVWEDYYDQESKEAMNSFFWNYKTDNTYLVKNDNEETIAVGCFDPKSERDDIPVEENQFSYLSLIVVDRHYRRMGIGENILDKMMSDCKENGNSPMILCTWERNKAMIKILQERGFNLFKLKKEHRYNDEDSLYFRKDFHSNSS